MVSDHGAPPAAQPLPELRLNLAQLKTVWGQKATQRPQWMQTKGSPAGSR